MFDPTVQWCDPFVGKEGIRMGQVRHGSVTTTHVMRATIQRSQAPLAALNRELGINPKTVAGGVRIPGSTLSGRDATARGRHP